MGDQVEPRRQFIERNARLVEQPGRLVGGRMRTDSALEGVIRHGR